MQLLRRALARQLARDARALGVSLEIGVTVGADHEHRSAREIARQELEQAQTRRIGPVQVVENQQHRLLVRCSLE